MKKLLVIAIIMFATTIVNAQSLTVPPMETSADSVSIMYQSMQKNNATIVKLNKAYTTHAAMVGFGGAFQLIGTAMTFYGSNETAKKVGMLTSVVGMGLIAASLLPMPKGVMVDERGVVIDLPTKKK